MTAPSPAWGSVYRRRGDVVTREVAGETLLVPIRGTLADLQRVFTLNRTGACVWGSLDGTRTLAAVRAELLRRFEENPALDADLRDFVARAVGAGLLEEVPA